MNLNEVIIIKSIIQENKACIVCGAVHNLHNHHIFFGVGKRKISENNGFTCYLCHRDHEGTEGVHGRDGHELDIKLKQLCQSEYEKTHSKEEFIKLIGKNYL